MASRNPPPSPLHRLRCRGPRSLPKPVTTLLPALLLALGGAALLVRAVAEDPMPDFAFRNEHWVCAPAAADERGTRVTHQLDEGLVDIDQGVVGSLQQGRERRAPDQAQAVDRMLHQGEGRALQARGRTKLDRGAAPDQLHQLQHDVRQAERDQRGHERDPLGQGVGLFTRAVQGARGEKHRDADDGREGRKAEKAAH